MPILNARFALNAANARWGSLYDALYGTDVISEDDGAGKGPGYNRVRGDRVIAYARLFLDDVVPLSSGSYTAITRFVIADGELEVALADGDVTGLADPEQFVGYTGDPSGPDSVLLLNHGLHIEILIDRDSPIGSDRSRRDHRCRAGVRDHHDHGLRGFGGRRGRRRQDSGLPQLARAE